MDLATLLEWFQPYFPLYFFSVLGLWWTPASLEKKRWIFPLWFLCFNLYVYSSVWEASVQGVPWALLVATQLPWIGVAFGFIWMWQKGLLEITLSQWVGWSTLRLVIAYYLLVLYSYEWPNEFLLLAAFSEAACGLMAPVVAFFYKKQWWVSRFLLVLWSVFGTYSIWTLNTGLVRIFWNQHMDVSAQSIASYWTHFPEVWIVGFWIPLILVIHAVVLWVYMKNAKRRG